MKISILLCAVLFTVSCSDSNDNLLPDDQLPDFNLDEVRHFIPDIYKESSKAIYINAEGEEKIFEIDYSEEMVDGKFMDKTFQFERIPIEITNDDYPKTSLYILGTGNYTRLDYYHTYVVCGISPFGPPGIRPTLTMGIEGPLAAPLEEEKILLDRTFRQVYRSDGLEENDAFSEMFYTAAEGIVGFRDFENTLWVLDRYE